MWQLTDTFVPVRGSELERHHHRALPRVPELHLSSLGLGDEPGLSGLESLAGRVLSPGEQVHRDPRLAREARQCALDRVEQGSRVARRELAELGQVTRSLPDVARRVLEIHVASNARRPSNGAGVGVDQLVQVDGNLVDLVLERDGVVQPGTSPRPRLSAVFHVEDRDAEGLSTVPRPVNGPSLVALVLPLRPATASSGYLVREQPVPLLDAIGPVEVETLDAPAVGVARTDLRRRPHLDDVGEPVGGVILVDELEGAGMVEADLGAPELLVPVHSQSAVPELERLGMRRSLQTVPAAGLPPLLEKRPDRVRDLARLLVLDGVRCREADDLEPLAEHVHHDVAEVLLEAEARLVEHLARAVAQRDLVVTVVELLVLGVLTQPNLAHVGGFVEPILHLIGCKVRGAGDVGH